jgi:hypothetical protein
VLFETEVSNPTEKLSTVARAAALASLKLGRHAPIVTAACGLLWLKW